MSRWLSWLAVVSLFAVGSSAVLAQSSRFDTLSEQADQAYCSEQFSKAIQLSLQALDAESGEDFKDIANQLARLAGSSEKLRDYGAAETYYARALVLAEQRFGKDSINAAFYMEALARALIRNGKVDQAKEIYDRVAAIRAKMIVDGFDAFKARHIANAARVALSRKQWRQAFDTYLDAVAAIDERVARMSSGDSLADLSSEMNNSTFIGLAKAAWQLSKVPGEDAGKLMGRSFEALQAKWRTAAAFAIEEAAARSRYPSLRAVQDRGELLSQLEAEREDLDQAWFQKREQDPVYHAASQRQSQLGANLSPEAVLSGFQEQQALSEKLLAEYQKCGANLTAECQAKIKRLQADVNTSISALTAKGSTYQEAGEQLTEMEKGIDGYGEYRRKSAEIQERIAALSAEGSTEAPSHITPSGLTPTAKPLPLGVSDVQALLHDDEALVTFIVGDDGGFVWAISHDGAMWSEIPLDSAALDESVNTLRTALEPPSADGATPSPETGRAPFSLPLAHELYAKLLGPVEKLIAGKRHLILVPTGTLTSLPFQVLVTEPPEPSLPELEGYRAASWLARRYALSTLPSVSTLKNLRASLAHKPHVSLSLIGFGDPNFDRPITSSRPNSQEVLETVARCSRSKFLEATSLPALPDTKIELDEVRKAVGSANSKVYVGRDATEKRVKSLSKSGMLGHYKVVYFATHGLVTGEVKGLLEPALALTIPNTATDDDDGLLTASEIAQLRLDADWVVLSACNTSSARRPGEETLSGLARAFLYAGGHALLVSNWPTDSYAARQLIISTFSALAAQPAIGRAEALRRAMLDIVDNADPVGAHPSYWAPFVVIGDVSG